MSVRRGQYRGTAAALGLPLSLEEECHDCHGHSLLACLETPCRCHAEAVVREAGLGWSVEWKRREDGRC